MGRRHAAAAAGIAQAQVDEKLREATARRESAERERQLLTSYLGSREQVSGTGRFANASPETLKYTQRYSVDQRALQEILASGSQVKRQEDPFQGADNRVRGGLSIQDYGQGFANRANDLLAQAEAAARAGDLTAAERLFAEAQAVIGGVSQVAQEAYNLGGGEESAAAVRASSTEGRIVGRQLLAAQELQDPNSETSTGLRGRLLDPALGIIGETTKQIISEIDEGEKEAQRVIAESTRNAERAVAAERSQIDGEIRQRGSGGGVGLNARAQLALQSRAASEAARRRADIYGNAAAQSASIASDAAVQRAGIYSVQGAQRAQLVAQVDLYLNEFAKRMAEDSVRLAQDWVAGSAGVRDEYQAALDRFDLIAIDLANQKAQMLAAVAEARRTEEKAKKAARRDEFIGFQTGLIPLATVFGGQKPQTSAQPVQANLGARGGNIAGVGDGDVAFGAVAGPNGAESTTVGAGGGGGLGGGGGGGFLGTIGTLFGFL